MSFRSTFSKTVYVGLHGYDFMTSGQKAWNLFRSRGWSIIVNDCLVHRCLNMIATIIGLICGVIALIMVQSNPSWASPSLLLGNNNGGDKDGLGSFVHFAMIVGFLYGVLIAKSIFKPILTAVDTVVVCFAEAPDDFTAHYPQLSRRMREAWRATYPSEYNVDDA